MRSQSTGAGPSSYTSCDLHPPGRDTSVWLNGRMDGWRCHDAAVTLRPHSIMLHALCGSDAGRFIAVFVSLYWSTSEDVHVHLAEHLTHVSQLWTSKTTTVNPQTHGFLLFITNGTMWLRRQSKERVTESAVCTVYSMKRNNNTLTLQLSATSFSSLLVKYLKPDLINQHTAAAHKLLGKKSWMQLQLLGHVNTQMWEQL